jgi:hypothetical protein
MTRCTQVLLLAVLGVLPCSAVPLGAEVVVGEEVPSAIAETALAYSSALLDAELATSWGLLSAKSRTEITAVEWEESWRLRPTSRPPSAQSLLRALAGAEEPPSGGEVLLTPGQALIQVSENVRITQELVLVREGDRWLVDLLASDELNARAAAEVFLNAVAAEVKGAAAPRPVRTPGAGRPMLQAVLAPQAKEFYVLQADVEDDRARVTLACDLQVSIVLRATRLGAGWTVDLSRPVVNVDPTSAYPLRDAADSARKATCQEQLQKLGRAFEMYAAASDDLLPDADRWVELMRPFGARDMLLHCPADSVPGISYAMNRNLAGKRRSQVANPSSTPLLFESALHTANPSDKGGSWPEPALHADGNLVLYVDGSIRAVKRKPSFTVKEGRGGAAAQPAPRLRVPARPPRQPR